MQSKGYSIFATGSFAETREVFLGDEGDGETISRPLRFGFILGKTQRLFVERGVEELSLPVPDPNKRDYILGCMYVLCDMLLGL